MRFVFDVYNVIVKTIDIRGGRLVVDWQAIKTEYITTSTSYRKLAQKYGVGYQAICIRSQDEGWISLREQHTNKTVTKAIEKISKKKVDRYTRLMNASDRLLKKVEKAIDELDLTLATNVKKTKTIEYNNPERPDKPTKEVIDEETEILSVSTIIDRNGLKAIASALTAIKDVQMIRSDLDIREQEARIANLERQANGGTAGETEDNESISKELFPDEQQTDA